VSNVYQPVLVTNQDSLYTLQVGPIKMVVDASVGARITEFSYSGTNVLTGPAVNPTNYGSTFWTSPQASWSWPPVPAIDNLPYTGRADSASNSIQLVSGVATIGTGQVTVTKKFVPVPGSGAIDITYTLTNVSSASVSMAPWAISRVAGSGGLTFLGKGPGTYSSTGTLALSEASGILWYSFVAATTDSKAKADGLGWIAHVTNSNLLYLLEYPDIQATDAAPGEAEVEIYTGPNGNYVEIEPQGAYTPVGPNGTLVWTVRWKLRPIPSGTSFSVGSPDLVTFTQQQLGQ
jgi:hypothetical protein